MRDLQDLRRVFDEVIELRRAGYSVVGDEAQFQGFYNYLSNPPDAENRHYLDLGGHKRNCDVGLRTMLIFPNGDVHFCDYLKEAIGNVHKSSLSEIYYRQTASKQRGQMVFSNIDYQATCLRHTPLLVKARAFLRMG